MTYLRSNLSLSLTLNLCIVSSKLLFKSIFNEFAKQINTNRLSPSSASIVFSSSVDFFFSHHDYD